MKSPIDIYILLPIILKTILGIFLPISGLRTLLIDLGVGLGSLSVANFLYQLDKTCKTSSVVGRLLKSISNAGSQYFGGVLFSVLVVLLPFFKIPVMIMSNIPGASYVLESFVWGLGVILTSVILNLFDSASKSKEAVCNGTIGTTRIIVSLIVFLFAAIFQFFTM
jgi:hypothetical protein